MPKTSYIYDCAMSGLTRYSAKRVATDLAEIYVSNSPHICLLFGYFFLFMWRGSNIYPKQEGALFTSKCRLQHTKWVLKTVQTSKAQTRLCICTVRSEPLVSAHTIYGPKQNYMHTLKALARLLCLTHWFESSLVLRSVISTVFV